MGHAGRVTLSQHWSMRNRCAISVESSNEARRCITVVEVPEVVAVLYNRSNRASRAGHTAQLS